ncbi:MAG: polysaccharide biosynthesis/export family protein [Kiritimatiellia bacterium]
MLAGLTMSLAWLMFMSTGCGSLQRLVSSPPPPFPKAVAEEPKIRPGVPLKIIISASGKSDEYQPIIVSQAGEVSLPLINVVKCEGMTLLELQDKLKTVCARFFLEPQISVQFLFVENMLSPWGTVLIKGKVAREGPVNIPPTCDLTLTRALQLAGNITPLGDQSKVKITRTMPDGKKYSIDVDVEAIGKHGRREDDHVLQANDVIWVPDIVW